MARPEEITKVQAELKKLRRSLQVLDLHMRKVIRELECRNPQYQVVQLGLLAPKRPVKGRRRLASFH